MSSPGDGVSTRSMRLKVLYTFDAESKNNCLARWPQALEVQTAFIDDLTQIGVVDLSTCLQALTSSSPELLSLEAPDYTVYAYDYSEEGIPLSGQGMLSSVFDPTSEVNTAEGASKVITGRVTKNVLGLFTSNGQETLEVKLRLLPVAKPGMGHRVHSPSVTQIWNGGQRQALDAPAWSNSQQGENCSAVRQQSINPNSPVDTTSLENVQRMLHEGGSPRELSSNQLSEFPRAVSNSRPGSRPGTPSAGQSFNAPPRQPLSHSSGRASATVTSGSAKQIPQKRRESFNSGYYSGEDNQAEDGPAKKRARITQVNAPSRSDLNIERQPESLRMVASTASSVRVHRPTAINPTLGHLQLGNTAEEPVRPPTPIPGGKKPVPRRLNSEPIGLLRHGSHQTLPNTTQRGSPSFTGGLDTSATSPDFSRGPSVSSTPINVPSSPPVMTNYVSMPSSPFLPPPRSESGVQDSGFVSGYDEMTVDVFDPISFPPNGDGHSMQPHQSIEQNAVAALFDHMAPNFQKGNDSQPDPVGVTLPVPPQVPNEATSFSQQLPRQTSRPPVRGGMSSPRLAPAPYPRARQLEEEMAAQPSLPPVIASDSVGRQLHRSNTWTGDMSDLPTSDAAPNGEGGRAKGVSKKKVGRAQTKARLENALAQNEMPPYCDNCGTIDTPAWRRVFAKTLPGNLFHSLQVWPEAPGAFVWKQIVAQEGDGSIKTFRAYKLSKSSEDKGEEWSNITLCNPCGLWFHKNKCMRPEEKWGRNPKDPNQKRKRANRPKSRRVAAKKGQEEESKSDAPEAGSEGSSPADGVTEAEPDGEDDGQVRNPDATDTEQQPCLDQVRSTQAGLRGGDSLSGPSQSFPGTLEARSSPLAVDETQLTPKPVRRQLFPSPNASASSKSKVSFEGANTTQPLVEVSNDCRRSPRLNKMHRVQTHQRDIPDADKENRGPGKGGRDELYELFDDREDIFQTAPPDTPTPVRRSDRILANTPSKTPSSSRNRVPRADVSPSVDRSARNHKTLKSDFSTWSSATFGGVTSCTSVIHEESGGRAASSSSARSPHGTEFSPSTNRPTSSCPETPRKSSIMGSNRTMEEMTPFTRLMHAELGGDARPSNHAEANALGRNHATHTPSQRSDAGSANPSLPSELSPFSRRVASLETVHYDMLGPDVGHMFDADPFGVNPPSDGMYDFLNSDYLDPGMHVDPWVDGHGGNEAIANPDSVVVVQKPTRPRRSPRKNKST